MFRLQRGWYSIASGLTVALLTITCSIGAGNGSSQPFVAPVSLNQAPATATATFVPPPATALPTALPTVTETPIPAPTIMYLPPILYTTQAGDTLNVVAARYGVSPADITSTQALTEEVLLPPGLTLIIPNVLTNITSPEKVLPDSEFVFSPSATNFDVRAFVNEAGGYLSRYHQYLGSTGTTSGADVIERVAIENSINPRLLLALLEYRSGWVYGEPFDMSREDYPMGLVDYNERGLYQQLAWAVNILSTGYYGWREGRLTEVWFSDGVNARLAPNLNAGTAGLQYFFAHQNTADNWYHSLYDPTGGFPVLYEQMFGNPWVRANMVEPLYPAGITQPPLILPFLVGPMWSLSGGPHGAWERAGARAALDFAPGSTESGCVPSNAWVTAMAAGLVVRSGRGVVVVDLDGDGYEQTGWVLLYLHVATEHRVPINTLVEIGDLIGHPSCEGGQSTGTHVHVARKYNGEWLPADGPIPFVLSGWTAHAGANPYEGSLTRGDQTVYASIYGSFESRIWRDAEGR